MTIKQRKWTMQKALEFIEEYEQRLPDLNDEDWSFLCKEKLKEILSGAKNNPEVRNLLFEIMAEMEQENER